ncbi:MAG: PAS domain S-box protein [Dehalococcoidia bacterium]|nr:PAS domain S-box protein [Dehalococcoidia bacterium]
MATEFTPDIAHLLFEQAPDGIIFADRDGIIRAWNAAAERVFGYRSEHALGQSLDLIIPEQFREAHWRGYRRAIEEGTTKYEGRHMPTRSHRADGSTLYVELSFAIVTEGGRALGALAHVRDITERFQQERENRKRLQELERRLEALQTG